MVVATGQEFRDYVRSSHSYGTMLGVEEEASRLREECGEGWAVEELRCPGAKDVCWSMEPEQRVELKG